MIDPAPTLLESPPTEMTKTASRPWLPGPAFLLPLEIRAIIRANARSGRMARSLAAGRYATACDYARGVTRHYAAWRPAVHELIDRRGDAAWAALFDSLRRTARRYLRHAAPYLLDGLDAAADSAAADAAIELLRSRYPYDCDFMAWAYAILRTVCRHTLTAHCRGGDLLDRCGADPDDDGGSLDFGLYDGGLDDAALDLAWATRRLATPCRRAFVRLHYFEGLSYDQLAIALGKSHNALYKLNSDTLANYRRLLA